MAGLAGNGTGRGGDAPREGIVCTGVVERKEEELLKEMFRTVAFRPASFGR